MAGKEPREIQRLHEGIPEEKQMRCKYAGRSLEYLTYIVLRDGHNVECCQERTPSRCYLTKKLIEKDLAYHDRGHYWWTHKGNEIYRKMQKKTPFEIEMENLVEM